MEVRHRQQQQQQQPSVCVEEFFWCRFVGRRPACLRRMLLVPLSDVIASDARRRVAAAAPRPASVAGRSCACNLFQRTTHHQPGCLRTKSAQPTCADWTAPLADSDPHSFVNNNNNNVPLVDWRYNANQTYRRVKLG